MIPQGKEGKSKPYFGEYPSDFFDFIIIDECHRGGANDESEWRAIMEYFNSAVQLGLTATPKNDQNTDTYKYFGYPVYTYSLKEGINDGFLTPYRIRRMQSSLDEYKFSPGDTVLQGEIDKDQTYIEKDFNRNIVIEEREIDRVKCFLEDANQEQKAIVFCSNQEHAKMIRDYINEYSSIKHPFYCVRVTADDGEEGEVKLREFQDNEKLFPTILTTSRKLSTGVDARNIRNIVLLREVKSIIEFKQIIGRGTRLFDEKEYFTIYDFVGASNHFYDPEWDGEPIEVICNQCGKDPCICKSEQPKECPICQQSPCKCPAEERQPCEKCGKLSCECIKIIKIKLSDNTMREIVHTTTTTFLNADGNRITAEEFLNNLLGELPNHFESEEELRKIWSNPETRSGLLNKLSDVGFPEHSLSYLQKLVDMEKSDLFDVLGYVFNSNFKVQTRQARVDASKKDILASLNDNQKEFISFVLSKYVESGVSQLSQRNLPDLLKLKYKTTRDAEMVLGSQEKIIQIFMKFQNNLYNRIA